MMDSVPCRPTRSQDVCAIAVTYHPDANFPPESRRILPQVRALVIVDNGSGEAELQMLRELAANPSITLVVESQRISALRAR